jgi:hypothetical protein
MVIHRQICRAVDTDLIFTTAAGRRVVEKLFRAGKGNLNGFPVILARRAASTDWEPALLPPNPPPTYGVMTRTFLELIPKTRAISA